MVIGGLDACGDALDNGKLVARILNLAKVVPWVKLLVTSRPERTITTILPKADTCIQLDLTQEEETAVDTECFIRTHLERLSLTADSDKAHELIPFASGQLFPCKTLLKHLETSRNPRRAGPDSAVVLLHCFYRFV